MLVLDAHADTEANRRRQAIRALISAGDYESADRLIQNHNWIHPLTPSPVNSLIWISRISGLPDETRLAGFLKSTAAWNIEHAECISIDELDSAPVTGGTLFVSIDLDFFYYEDYSPRDISRIFDRLLDYSLNWEGGVLWAVCASLAWLPNVEYAWELLGQSIEWLIPKKEFMPPELSIFSTYRYDTSRRAESFRITGMEPPGFYLKEDTMPDTIRNLFSRLMDR
jgi:hypothetical protein